MDQLVVIHLSDLHISDDVDFRLLEALPISTRLVREVTRTSLKEPFYYLVSGDLTEDGSQRQFELVRDYLLSRCQVEINGELTSPVGFAIGDESRLAYVPGNHDNWGGASGPFTALGFNRAVTERYFGQLPWRRSWTSIKGTIEFELFGMDSNAGLQETPEILQGGVFAETHLRHLRELLVSSIVHDGDVHRVRAVMFHHGLSFDAQLVLSTSWVQESAEFLRAAVRSTTGGISEAFDPASERGLRHIRPAKAYPLRFQSRADLVSVCGTEHVSCFLTGHNHCFARRPIPVQTLDGNVILEFQAATALKTPPPHESRGFFVHQLVLDSEVLTWNAWAFKWTGTQFRPYRNVPDYSEIIGIN